MEDRIKVDDKIMSFVNKHSEPNYNFQLIFLKAGKVEINYVKDFFSEAFPFLKVSKIEKDRLFFKFKLLDVESKEELDYGNDTCNEVWFKLSIYNQTDLRLDFIHNFFSPKIFDVNGYPVYPNRYSQENNMLLEEGIKNFCLLTESVFIRGAAGAHSILEVRDKQFITKKGFSQNLKLYENNLKILEQGWEVDAKKSSRLEEFRENLKKKQRWI